MMEYIEATEEYNGTKKSLFLAGGITGCLDWHKKVSNDLEDLDIAVINPRRAKFPIDDPSAAKEQIEWEYRHLRKADMISFWFCEETLCPIALYELGAWAMTKKPIFVGVHPNYKRRADVEIQLGLIRPEVKIVYALDDLVEQIKIAHQK